jgi:hypothetical protein
LLECHLAAFLQNLRLCDLREQVFRMLLRRSVVSEERANIFLKPCFERLVWPSALELLKRQIHLQIISALRAGSLEVSDVISIIDKAERLP